MKKILIGFLAIGLLAFVGCDKEKQKGCTEPNAINYDSVAEENDGSCKYSETTEVKTDTDTDDGTTETLSDEAKDGDGNVYTSVKIGTQEWMVENLRTTRYSDGSLIPNVTNNTEWFNDTIGAWCHYDNGNLYETNFGKLYNWYAVETEKLCPTGWHVPTDDDWTVLTDYLGANGYSGSEGKALKSTLGWSSGGNGTDHYGWLGLPSGDRSSDGSFEGIGRVGIWWSSSEFNTSIAWYLGYSNVNLSSHYSSKKNGLSVRCLKD